MACVALKLRYWPGLEDAGRAELAEVGVTVAAALAPAESFCGPVLAPPDGGTGDIGVAAAAIVELPDDPFALPGTGGAGPTEETVGETAGGGGEGDAPPEALAATPSLTPAKEAAPIPATALAVVVIAPASVIIVLPTSPRTIRLAMNGISKIEIEKTLAVSARRIIWLDPTKLFRTPLAESTALTLERFTADIRTCRTA